MKSTKGVWTRFHDMSSGGREKEAFSICYIQAPYSRAMAIFEKRFNRDPYHITCECCGEDYSVSEYKSIDEATDFDRGNLSVSEYLKSKRVKFIFVTPPEGVLIKE